MGVEQLEDETLVTHAELEGGGGDRAAPGTPLDSQSHHETGVVAFPVVGAAHSVDPIADDGGADVVEAAADEVSRRLHCPTTSTRKETVSGVRFDSVILTACCRRDYHLSRWLVFTFIRGSIPYTFIHSFFLCFSQ